MKQSLTVNQLERSETDCSTRKTVDGTIMVCSHVQLQISIYNNKWKLSICIISAKIRCFRMQIGLLTKSTGPTEKELVTWSFDVLDENYDRQLVEKELNVSFILRHRFPRGSIRPLW